VVPREKPREARGEEPDEARQRGGGLAEYLLDHPLEILQDDPWVKAIRNPLIRKYSIGMLTAISLLFINTDVGDSESARRRESDREALQTGFSLLMKLIRDIPQKDLAIFAAFLMLRGALSLATVGIQPALEKVDALRKSAEARERKSRIKAEVIAHHAGPLLKRHPSYTSHRVAAEICKAVNEALAPHGLALKIDAIRNRVQTYRSQLA